jgi:hypothetical protein
MDIMMISDTILAILIELDIFIIIFSSYLMIDTLIMTDYITGVILIPIGHIIENISITKIMIGIEQKIIEMIESQYTVHITIEMKITNKIMNINKIMIEIKIIKKIKILTIEMINFIDRMKV